jgi:hypothetical protein
MKIREARSALVHDDAVDTRTLDLGVHKYINRTKKFIFSLIFSLLTALSLSVCAQTGAAVVGAGRWRHRAGNFNQSKKVNFIY